MHAYELPLETNRPSPSATAEHGLSDSLPEGLLAENARWFCRLRWLVVALLVLFGVMGLSWDLFRSLGLRQPGVWPFVIAGMLALGNVGFLAHSRSLRTRGGKGRAQENLWGQIGFDLLVLTTVVHCVGSLETPAAFAYLFHIALACIFFSRGDSFLVMAMASGLYVACVILEQNGLIGPGTIYSDLSLRQQMDHTRFLPLLTVSSSVVIFGVVWFLAAHLSGMVRQRDYELGETNRRLVEEQRKKAQHVLRTTHELKAPFAAIHANVQVLLKGHCGSLPDAATEVVVRIGQRCRRLATEIQEMLQLANLRSEPDSSHHWDHLDLAEEIKWCLGQVSPTAQERKVTLQHDLQAAQVFGVEDHFRMLFANLVSNAVLYSHPGGVVWVRCAALRGGGAEVTIEDNGIGIPEEKLPHIFEEYYRTEEAAQHNKQSTGLGLAIVRHVCLAHAIGLRVESTPDAGTKFTLRFPSTERKEIDDGVSDDR